MPAILATWEVEIRRPEVGWGVLGRWGKSEIPLHLNK
jgi:hypothetical protein